MKKVFAGLFLIIFLLLLAGCQLWRPKPLFSAIPQHTLFTNTNTIWQDFTIDTNYLRKQGRAETDTMLILTRDKMILVTGQYGRRTDDSIILPCDGYLGINYEVLENRKYILTDTLITVGNTHFRRNNMAEFQWWNEIMPKINGLGKGGVTVSGP